MILAKFQKQPRDVRDYDINFSDWLVGYADTADSCQVTVEPGIELETFSLDADVGAVKVWLSGGQDGNQYKVTVLLTTRGGRKKEVEIIVKVKEY